jgi:hypothetical protein
MRHYFDSQAIRKHPMAPLEIGVRDAGTEMPEGECDVWSRV